MSYKYRVLADKPLGYWTLSSNALYDESAYANTAQIIGGSEPTFTDILPLVTGSSYDTDLSGCKIGNTTNLNITNSSDIYKCFYHGTERLSLGIEAWISFDSAPTQDVVILNIGHSTDSIGKIYVNNDKIYFTVYDSNDVGYTAYKQIKSWDSQLHVFAYYSNRQINIGINSIFEDGFTLPENFNFKAQPANSTDIFYNIGPTPSGLAFVMNHLAFYDYKLSTNLIRSHMVWATNDSKPQTYIRDTSAHIFDLKDYENMFIMKKEFYDPVSFREGTLSNIVADKSGITLKTMPLLEEYNADESNTISTSTGKLVTTGTAAIVLNKLSEYINFNNFSIVGQLNWQNNSGSTNFSIIGFDGINNDEWLYLCQDTSNRLSLYQYKKNMEYPYDYSEVLLCQTASQNNTGFKNFGISINNSTVRIYIEGAAEVVYSSLPALYTKNINMYLGNSLDIASLSSYSNGIKNISVLNSAISPYEYESFGQQDQLTMTFNNTTNISQLGSWTYKLPSSGINKIYGVTANWNSGTSDNYSLSTSQYAKIEVSFDNGLTWIQIYNNSPISHFDDGAEVLYPDILFKATIFSKDSSLKDLPRIENLLLNVYDNMSMISDTAKYQIFPKDGSYIGDTFAIRKNFNNIMARSENIGLKLKKTSNKNSTIKIIATDIAPTHRSIEFWFKYNGSTELKEQTVIDTLGSNETIYFSASDGSMNQNGFASVFVNGIDFTNSTRVLVENETYHFVCVYSSETKNPIYLGGNERSNSFSYGSFGFVTIYPNALSQTDAQNRYLSYLTSQVARVDYPYGGSNIISAISEFAGGSTSYNSGSAILSYPQPYFNG